MPIVNVSLRVNTESLSNIKYYCPSYVLQRLLVLNKLPSM